MLDQLMRERRLQQRIYKKSVQVHSLVLNGQILAMQNNKIQCEREEILLEDNMVQALTLQKSASNLGQGISPGPDIMPRKQGACGLQGDSVIGPPTPEKPQKRKRNSLTQQLPQALGYLLSDQEDVRQSNGRKTSPATSSPVPSLDNRPQKSTGGRHVAPNSGPLACISADKDEISSLYIDLSQYFSTNSNSSIIVSTPQSTGLDAQSNRPVGSLGTSEELPMVELCTSKASRIFEEPYPPSRMTSGNAGQLQAGNACAHLTTGFVPIGYSHGNLETGSDPVGRAKTNAVNADNAHGDLEACLTAASNSCCDMGTCSLQVCECHVCKDLESSCIPANMSHDDVAKGDLCSSLTHPASEGGHYGDVDSNIFLAGGSNGRYIYNSISVSASPTLSSSEGGVANANFLRPGTEEQAPAPARQNLASPVSYPACLFNDINSPSPLFALSSFGSSASTPPPQPDGSSTQSTFMPLGSGNFQNHGQLNILGVPSIPCTARDQLRTVSMSNSSQTSYVRASCTTVVAPAQATLLPCQPHGSAEFGARLHEFQRASQAAIPATAIGNRNPLVSPCRSAPQETYLEYASARNNLETPATPEKKHVEKSLRSWLPTKRHAGFRASETTLPQSSSQVHVYLPPSISSTVPTQGAADSAVSEITQANQRDLPQDRSGHSHVPIVTALESSHGRKEGHSFDLNEVPGLLETVVNGKVKRKYTPKVAKDKRPAKAPKEKKTNGRPMGKPTSTDGVGVVETSCGERFGGIPSAFNDNSAKRKYMKKRKGLAEGGDSSTPGDDVTDHGNHVKHVRNTGFEMAVDRVGSIPASVVHVNNAAALVNNMYRREQPKPVEGENLNSPTDQPRKIGHDKAFCECDSCEKFRLTEKSNVKIRQKKTKNESLVTKHSNVETGMVQCSILEQQPAGEALVGRSSMGHSIAEATMNGQSFTEFSSNGVAWEGRSSVGLSNDGAELVRTSLVEQFTFGIVAPAGMSLREQWTVESPPNRTSSLKTYNDRELSGKESTINASSNRRVEQSVTTGRSFMKRRTASKGRERVTIETYKRREERVNMEPYGAGDRHIIDSVNAEGDSWEGTPIINDLNSNHSPEMAGSSDVVQQSNSDSHSVRRSLIQQFNIEAASERRFCDAQSFAASEDRFCNGQIAGSVGRNDNSNDSRSESIVTEHRGSQFFQPVSHAGAYHYSHQGSVQTMSSMARFEGLHEAMNGSSTELTTLFQSLCPRSVLVHQPIPFLSMNDLQRIVYLRGLLTFPGISLSPVALWHHVLEHLPETERDPVVALWPHVMELLPAIQKEEIVFNWPHIMDAEQVMQQRNNFNALSQGLQMLRVIALWPQVMQQYLPLQDTEQVAQPEHNNDASSQGLQMVPYEGKNGALVPYDGPFNPLRKRKPRPKVVLDTETMRVWKLLMGKSGNMENETDSDKELKWAEERRIMKARAESFISHMHLVQGDRSFSRWKGSVVDSVVGAFLTQNVNDVLSSSAFMCVRARFPATGRGVTGLNQASAPEKVGDPLENELLGLTMQDCDATTATLLSCSEHHRREGLDPNGAVSDCKPATSHVLSVDNWPELLRDRDSGTQQDQDEGCAKSQLECGETVLSWTEVVQVGLLECEEKSWHHQEQGKEKELVQKSVSVTIGTGCPNDKMEATSADSLAPTVQAMLEDSSILKLDSSAANTPVDLLPMQEVRDDARELSKDNVVSSEAMNESTITKGKFNPTRLTGPERARLEQSQISSRKAFDWEALRGGVDAKGEKIQSRNSGHKHERSPLAEDGVDWEAVRHAEVEDLADVIKERGMNWILAGRIKAFLERLHIEHGSLDLEWLRSLPLDDAKDFLLSVRGLGLKSVECIRLLTLHHLAFPVDTNVGRICVRLGWVPLEPLPEELQLHLLELYPVQATIQKYLWPRLCTLDQQTLYELHYQMITFGKVFCTKSKPNCNACPMRGDCKHFASALASAKLALPSQETEGKPILALPPTATEANSGNSTVLEVGHQQETALMFPTLQAVSQAFCEPIIEEPSSPEQSDADLSDCDIEDEPFSVEIKDNSVVTRFLKESNLGEPMQVDISNSCQLPNPDNIATESEPVSRMLHGDLADLSPPSEATSFEVDKSKRKLPSSSTIGMNSGVNTQMTLESPGIFPSSEALMSDVPSQELVLLPPGAASIPVPKLKNIGRLRTVHYVYELPDHHPLVEGMDTREPDDPCCYLLAIWSPGETPGTIPNLEDCHEDNPFASSGHGGEAETVKGTLLVPCRTAMQGSFPLNGTYFQVNEVFADHTSSLQPVEVPRTLLWNLRRRFVFFGTSVTSIFRGMTTEEIQACFWRGYICVRGFDRNSRSPKPLVPRLHLQATKSSPSKASKMDSNA